MRKLLVSAILALASLAGANAANAQTATQDITLNASVASYCTIGGATNPSALTRTVPVTNGVVDTTAINVSVASVVCNNAADVIATSVRGGVWDGNASSAPGTVNIINYTAAATFGSVTSTINTATASGAAAAANEAGNTATTAGAASGNLAVAITPQAAGGTLEPSTGYTDTLRVTLTAH